MSKEPRLQFLKVPGADARREFEQLIEQYTTPPNKKHLVCVHLYLHLQEITGNITAHRNTLNVWRTYQSKKHGELHVVLTETDPFVAYTVMRKGKPSKMVVIAVLFGERLGRRAAVFYGDVWNEVSVRLQKLG